jgi:hypothetical protein
MLDESEEFARTQALRKTSVPTRDGRFRAFSFASKERIGSAQGVRRHRLALKEPTRSPVESRNSCSM